jgi:hypothetical protein
MNRKDLMYEHAKMLMEVQILARSAIDLISQNEDQAAIEALEEIEEILK